MIESREIRPKCGSLEVVDENSLGCFYPFLLLFIRNLIEIRTTMEMFCYLIFLTNKKNSVISSSTNEFTFVFDVDIIQKMILPCLPIRLVRLHDGKLRLGFLRYPLNAKFVEIYKFFTNRTNKQTRTKVNGKLINDHFKSKKKPFDRVCTVSSSRTFCEQVLNESFGLLFGLRDGDRLYEFL